jgi:uncharacterized protein YgbK (DUF1537 family)
MALATLIVVVVTLAMLVLLDGKTNLSLLGRITEIEKRIIMTNTELTVALDNQKTQIGKIAKEQSDRFDALTKTIADLNAIITAGGDVPTTVTDALAATQAALDSLDAAIPDAPVA